MLSAHAKKLQRQRLAFWKGWLSPESPWPEDRDERLKPVRELPEWAVEVIEAAAGPRRILDVNAGPVSALGNRASGQPVELVAIDEQALELNLLLEDLGMEAPVKAQFCSPEDVLVTFGRAAFSLIYSFNGLSQHRDPVALYRTLLECLAPGGRIITFHEAPPQNGDFEFHRNPDRYYHVLKGGRAVIQRKTFRRDLQDALPGAGLHASIEDGWLRLEIRHSAGEPRDYPLPARRPAGADLPALLSMHLPKTAGSSFLNLLKDLYGDGLRCMYLEEETDPDLLDTVQLQPSVRCLHGHFQADAYLSQLPEALLITWLRHPIERVVSNYFQIQRHPESAISSELNLRVLQEGWSLMDFARQQDVRTMVQWYFNAVPLDAFFFVGITEQFDASLRLFCHLMNVPSPEIDIRANVNPDKGLMSRYELTAEQRGELLALYAGEIALYEQARERLEAQLEQAFGDQSPAR